MKKFIWIYEELIDFLVDVKRDNIVISFKVYEHSCNSRCDYIFHTGFFNHNIEVFGLICFWFSFIAREHNYEVTYSFNMNEFVITLNSEEEDSCDD